MIKFIEDFSEEDRIIIGNVIGIFSTIIFIYLSSKADYYYKIYLSINKNIFEFMKEVNIVTMTFLFILLIATVLLALSSIYLNGFNLFNSSKKFSKISSVIAILITIIGVVSGVYGALNIMKLLGFVVFASLCVMFIISGMNQKD